MSHSKSPLILLVEDNENDAMLIRAALAHMAQPPSIEWMKDTGQAIEYLAGADSAGQPVPALVLCDLRMPAGDGMTFLKWIRARKKFQNIPFVIVTGSSVVSDWQNALSAGATCFVYKDSLAVEPKRFARTVEECLAE